MWNGEIPVIIDWEASGFVHQAYDLIETAMYWAKDDRNEIQRDRMIAFIKSYKEVSPELELEMNLEAVLNKGYSKLGWLEYSLKRSIGIECADDEERKMGTEHVFWSINDLLNYEDKIPTLMEWIMDV